VAVRLTALAIRKGVKKCRVCKIIKPISEFIKDLTPDTKWMPNDCLDCERIRRKERWPHNKKTEILKKNGLKPDKCQICGSKEQVGYDHCHTTHIHRGWLCRKCNSIISWCDEDPERLRKMADYLDKFYTSEEVLRFLDEE
jgi:hypothetical protein